MTKKGPTWGPRARDAQRPLVPPTHNTKKSAPPPPGPGRRRPKRAEEDHATTGAARRRRRLLEPESRRLRGGLGARRSSSSSRRWFSSGRPWWIGGNERPDPDGTARGHFMNRAVDAGDGAHRHASPPSSSRDDGGGRGRATGGYSRGVARETPAREGREFQEPIRMAPGGSAAAAGRSSDDDRSAVAKQKQQRRRRRRRLSLSRIWTKSTTGVRRWGSGQWRGSFRDRRRHITDRRSMASPPRFAFAHLRSPMSPARRERKRSSHSRAATATAREFPPVCVRRRCRCRRRRRRRRAAGAVEDGPMREPMRVGNKEQTQQTIVESVHRRGVSCPRRVVEAERLSRTCTGRGSLTSSRTGNGSRRGAGSACPTGRRGPGPAGVVPIPSLRGGTASRTCAAFRIRATTGRRKPTSVGTSPRDEEPRRFVAFACGLDGRRRTGRTTSPRNLKIQMKMEILHTL